MQSKLCFKFFILYFTIILSIFLSSCVTAITTEKNIEKYEIQTKYTSPKMDYIGFKIDTNILSTSSSSKIETGVWKPEVNTIMSEFDQAKAISNTKSLRQLGYNLENTGIAINKSDSYFGIYSLQEMELYKTSNKYVTFIEVAQSKLNYNENKSLQRIMGGLGGGFLGAGVPLLLLGNSYKNDRYVKEKAKSYMTVGGVCLGLSVPFLIIAATPTKTNVSFEGLYNIYLYDTTTKSLIRKETVTVNCSENFNGSYSYDEQSKTIVWNWVSQNVYNAIMKKYDEINQWLIEK